MSQVGGTATGKASEEGAPTVIDAYYSLLAEGVHFKDLPEEKQHFTKVDLDEALRILAEDDSNTISPAARYHALEQLARPLEGEGLAPRRGLPGYTSLGSERIRRVPRVRRDVRRGREGSRARRARPRAGGLRRARPDRDDAVAAGPGRPRPEPNLLLRSRHRAHQRGDGRADPVPLQPVRLHRGLQGARRLAGPDDVARSRSAALQVRDGLGTAGEDHGAGEGGRWMAGHVPRAGGAGRPPAQHLPRLLVLVPR